MLRSLALALVASGSLLAADTFKIDDTHAYALFKVNHMGVADNYGRFNAIEGTVTLDAANPAANAVSITIKTDSVDTQQAKRDQHLKQADFLNAKQYPTMTFVSSAWTTTASGFDVTGAFTLGGVAKTITVPVVQGPVVKDPWGLNRTGFGTTFTIKRSDHGLQVTPGVSDEVTVILSVEAVKP